METTVVIRGDDGEAERVIGSRRVVRMILYLLQNERILGAIPKGQLVFNFAGENGLTYQVSESGELVGNRQ